MSWIDESERRSRLLAQFTQPLTATQLARRADLTRGQVSHCLTDLAVCRLIRCLNQTSPASRLYWLTVLGRACHRHVRERENNPMTSPPNLSAIDWDLYGWVCFRQRSAVLLALTEPLQPAEIKRRARRINQHLRMSASNVRDIIRLFLERGIVRAVRVKRYAHPRYVLTELGESLRSLLIAAEMRH